MLAGYVRSGGGQRRIVGLVDDELEAQALGIVEQQRRRLLARSRCPRRPRRAAQYSSASAFATRHMMRCTMPAPGVPARSAGNSKKVMMLPGCAALVAVVEVVEVGRVEVDRLLDHPQPEHPHVEVDVALGVRGDRRYVMDSIQVHLDLWDARCRSGAPTLSSRTLLDSEDRRPDRVRRQGIAEKVANDWRKGDG